MKVKVELEIEVTGDATEKEVRDYLMYEFGYMGACPVTNPFFESDCEYETNGFNMEVV